MKSRIKFMSDSPYFKDRDALIIKTNESNKVEFKVIEDVGSNTEVSKKKKISSKSLEKFILHLTNVTESLREMKNQGNSNGSTKEYFVKIKSKTSLSVIGSNGQVGIAVNPKYDACAIVYFTLERAESLTLELINLAEQIEEE